MQSYVFPGTNKTYAESCKIENFKYMCQNHQCVHLNAVCNGKDDCGDKSDEGAGCEYTIYISTYFNCCINFITTNFNYIAFYFNAFKSFVI